MKTSDFPAVILLSTALAGLAGCGLLGYKYETAEVRDVVKGVVPSPSERYRIPKPEIPVLRKNCGIVREGGLFVLIVGPDLKKTLNEHSGDDVELGVHFLREPRRHLVLERVWVGGQEAAKLDWENFRYRLPNLVAAAEIPMDQFDQEVGLCEVPPDAERTLTEVLDRKVHVSEFHVRKAEVPESLRETELAAASGRRLDRPQYFITSQGADYLVTSRDPMTFLMLDYLLQENREFQGGIRVRGLFDRDRRVATRVAGTADVDWIALGGTLYFSAI